jgi:hypothetical protein
MSVRAKFYVGEKAERSNHPNPNYPVQTFETVILYPVNGGSEENKNFFQYTPSGKIELGIMNQEAAKQFEVGKEYYVDFTSESERKGLTMNVSVKDMEVFKQLSEVVLKAVAEIESSDVRQKILDDLASVIQTAE